MTFGESHPYHDSLEKAIAVSKEVQAVCSACPFFGKCAPRHIVSTTKDGKFVAGVEGQDVRRVWNGGSCQAVRGYMSLANYARNPNKHICFYYPESGRYEPLN